MKLIGNFFLILTFFLFVFGCTEKECEECTKEECKDAEKEGNTQETQDNTDGTETDSATSSRAIQVSLGYNHSCALLEDGRVKCWGYNVDGRLGDGTTSERNSATQVVGITDAVQISAGVSHTCAIHFDQTVSCWGQNDEGQLGNGTKIPSLVPKKVANLNSAKSISSGLDRTCAVTSDRYVYCWGYQRGGPLATSEDPYQSLFPNKVNGLSAVSEISVSWSHTCALLENGHVKCWGFNYGSLGDGTTIDRKEPTEVLNLNNAIAISSGYGYTCSILSDQTAKCWGENDGGHLGNGMSGGEMLSYDEGIDSLIPTDVLNLNNVVDITTSYHEHTCARLNDSRVKCWGNNTHAQIGDGTQYGERVLPTTVLNLRNVTDISAGSLHTCAVTSNGQVMCWGSNGFGKLGIGTNDWSAKEPKMVTGL